MAIVILVPLSLVEQMRHISYISLIAVGCISLSLFYILVNDCYLIASSPQTQYTKKLIWWDISGMPFFFGLASFMFEGNALALEIY